MKQCSRKLLAGYYVMRCQLLCETRVKDREHSSVMMFFNIWRVLELTCSRQSYLSEVETIPIPEEQSQANSKKLIQ